MKKILVVLAILAVMAAGVGCILGVSARTILNKQLKGSGNMTTKTIPAPEFHEIDASRAVKVIISDKTELIRIDADDNIIDHVIAHAEGGELKISIDNSYNIRNLDVTVTVPANGKIRSLEASSAASITSEVGLSADEFSLKASSAANIHVAVNARKCEIETSSAANITTDLTAKSCEVESSSASKVTLSGSADFLDADISSAANLYAKQLVATDCNVETSSGASASVNCTGSLTGKASSGSSIRYVGDCQANTHTSSGGGIHKN